MDKDLPPQASATAKASLFKAGVKNPQRPLKSAEIDIFQAKAKGWLSPLGPGASASVNLVDAKASSFDLTLGAGVTTAGGRVKDDSLTVSVPGRGLGTTVGR